MKLLIAVTLNVLVMLMVWCLLCAVTYGVLEMGK